MNILIVKLSAIGDVIHALPVTHALKSCYPDARITWVVEKPAYEILTNNPMIDEIIIFDKPKFKTLSGLWTNGPEFARLLRSRNFDIALDLQGLFKSAAISILSGAAKRYVYCNSRELSNWVGERVCGPNQKGHVVEMYLDVVRHLGCKVKKTVFDITVSDQEKARAIQAANAAGLNLDKPFVVLSPGANWPNKCWPLHYFAEMADKIAGAGVVPVITGGPGDREMARAILQNTKSAAIDLTAKTSLKELAYVIQQARAFIGGDTGPMHLAAALDTPVIALHGPTDIVRNGPYGSQHTTIVAERSCAGCWKRRCRNSLDCLSVIGVDTVFAAVSKYIK